MLQFTPEVFKKEFFLYASARKDSFDHKVKIPLGVDGVSCKGFKNDLDHQVNSLSNRLINGKFLFSPFREKAVPKDPEMDIETALAAGKTRTISIGCLKDVLVQRVIYRVVKGYAEEQFNSLPRQVSFGYRPGISASQAAHAVYRYVQEGYVHVLDADIRKFFDEIPHQQLQVALEDFFPREDTLTLTYLKRFYSADKVPWESYQGETWKFYQKKPQRTPREIGLPQGGVLSGLLANIYLHQFDRGIMALGGDDYLRYVRYADDFLVMARRPEEAARLYDQAAELLDSLGLYMHRDEEKTRILDLSRVGEKLEFVGFQVTPRGVRLREANVQRFKSRVIKLLNEHEIRNSGPRLMKDLRHLSNRLNYKIVGNENHESFICQRCGRRQMYRNWAIYAHNITDFRQLKSLDRWIRKQINQKYYREAGARVDRKMMREAGLLELDKTCRRYRKEKKKDKAGEISYCRCAWEDPEAYAF